MQNATPLPQKFMQQTSKPPVTKPVATSQKVNEPNYVGIGVFVGFIVALGIIGGIYYKMKLDLVAPKQTKTITQQPTVNQTAQKSISPTPKTIQSTTPGVTPVVIQTPEDLVAQQTLLDNADFASISSELDKNLADAASFTQ